MTETPDRVLPPVHSPYPGLAPFATSDEAYFFGRESETKILLSNLFASRFTVAYGPSGVGKSSLINAGLAPKLKNQDDVVVLAYRKWVGDPVEQLRRAVRRSARRVLPDWETDSRDLAETCRQVSEASARYLMIILDQFEEYFLYNDIDSPFERVLASLLADDELPVRVLVSIREDSIARLDRFEGRISNLFDNVMRIEHLTRQGGRAAIIEPLKQYRLDTGLAVEIEPELVDNILNGVRAGQIVLSPGGGGMVSPVNDDHRIEAAYLQLVMERLWSVELAQDSAVIRQNTLVSLGGVGSAVRSRFTELMSSLSLTDQELAASLFHYLVTPSKTKIAWRSGDLAFYAGTDPERTKALLGRLTRQDYRVLRTVETVTLDGTEEVYEIYHDILARAIVEWQDSFQQRKVALSKDQLTRLKDVRNILAFYEREMDDTPVRRKREWYPVLLTLSAEAQLMDPQLARLARELAARIAKETDVAKAGRSASLIERRQVKLLQDEISLAGRSQLPATDLLKLYSPRLAPFPLSHDQEVRRDAQMLESRLRLLSDESLGVETPADGEPTIPSVGPVPPAGGGVAGDTINSESPADSAVPLKSGTGQGRERPLFQRWDFYIFLAVVPMLNIIPLILADRLAFAYLAPYRDLVRELVWLVMFGATAVWTAFHLYAVINNRVRGFQTLLVPFQPWSDGGILAEKCSGWPLNQLGPWIFGIVTMSLGDVVGLSPGWTFFPFVLAGYIFSGTMFYLAELLVWSRHQVREAFGLGGDWSAG